MNETELCYLPATELLRHLRAREVSPTEVVDAVIARIERVEPKVNAFVTLLPEEARAQAARATEELAKGDPDELPPLHGIPLVVKDLTNTAGIRTTYGSVNYADHVPTEDSVAWERMKASGAILLGKSTTPDFGMLGVTDSTLTGTTNNPWNLDRTAGGSSGGSAAAMAAGMGHLSWGSDGGGSIRIPSACCGTVGLKGSIGRIPGYGDHDVFQTVTVGGPITRTVADSALLLSVTAGPDRRDPVALPAPAVDYNEVIQNASVAGLKIAYTPDLGQVHVAKTVTAALEGAVDVWRELGAQVDQVDVNLPDALEYFLAWWGPEYYEFVDQELLRGVAPDSIPTAVYRMATLARQGGLDRHRRAERDTRPLIAAEFARLFASYDLLICPTMPLTAFPHNVEAGGATEIEGRPIEEPSLYFHRMTEPFSHPGLPTASIPCGFDPEGLPVGMQIAASHHEDDLVLRAAAAFEAATDWHRRHPEGL